MRRISPEREFVLLPATESETAEPAAVSSQTTLHISSLRLLLAHLSLAPSAVSSGIVSTHRPHRKLRGSAAPPRRLGRYRSAMRGFLVGQLLRRWLVMSLVVALLFENLPRAGALSRRLLRRRRPAYEIMTNDKPTQAPCEFVFFVLRLTHAASSLRFIRICRLLSQLRGSSLLRCVLVRCAQL